MFQFTTSNVINSKLRSNGKPLFVSATDSFHCHGAGKFTKLDANKCGVRKIYKRAYSAPVLGSVTLDLATVEEKELYRISLYIRLEGSEESSYSTSMLYKGKPIYIEFVKKPSESNLAERVAREVNSFVGGVYDEKVVVATGSANSLVLKAANQYQRFTSVKVEKFVSDGVWEDTAIVPNVVQGKEGFGTYDYIIRNLRLPTAQRTNWMSVNQDETPIVGGEYTQYVIHYAKHRGPLGMDAVGQDVTSLTTHVFYVLKSVATEFENALKTVGTIETV